MKDAAQATVRWQSEDPEVTHDYALYLFGAWKQAPDGTWRSNVRAGVPASEPHAVSVYVVADPERIAGLVQGIDFAGIAAIVR